MFSSANSDDGSPYLSDMIDERDGEPIFSKAYFIAILCFQIDKSSKDMVTRLKKNGLLPATIFG